LRVARTRRIAQAINPTAGTARIENRSGVGLPESTTAQYIEVEPKKERISAPRALTFNWNAPTLPTLEMALVVWLMRSSQLFLRESSTENNVSIEPLQFCRIRGHS
jgi:hypothetical protein